MLFPQLALTALLAAAHASQAASLPGNPHSTIQRRETVPPWQSITNDEPCTPTNLTYPYPLPAITTVQTGKNCSKYGDPPAPVVSIVQGPAGIQDVIGICHGEIITYTDNIGEARSACLYVNKASTKKKPLPLLVWLHPSGFPYSDVFELTGIDAIRDTQPLNNQDKTRVGFNYILPLGRNSLHQYPLIDRYTPGWDNWYRNLDRSSKALNADVDSIDKAIKIAKKKAIVDERRVFLSGWSNGAAMALLYGYNTPGIAATSVYSAPDPYRDAQDPCTQVPHPIYATPSQDMHNYCDIIGICTTGRYFYQDLKARYRSLKAGLVILDDVTSAVKSRNGAATCDMNCQGSCLTVEGAAAHGRWPVTRNSDTIFQFLHDNPLPASGTWGPPH